MSYLQAVLMGIIEGLTEYLPISSTFHEITFASILAIPTTEFVKLFEVVIQSGAILSVFILYFPLLFRDRTLLKNTFVSFIPTAVLGIILYKVVKDVFLVNVALRLSVFALVGVIFILFEYFVKAKKISLTRSVQGITLHEAFLIGIIQAIAFIPGVSRSGAVIVGMMFLRYKRDEAAKYSFLLSIPTIFAASAYDMYKAKDLLLTSSSSFLILLVGFIAAFMSSFVVIKWFLTYLKTRTLTVFGIYRIVLTMVILALGFY
ncbi:MAG: undecaprenyl-diphosphate phosphatase [bacterium]